MGDIFYNESSFWGMHLCWGIPFIVGHSRYSWALVYLLGATFYNESSFWDMYFCWGIPFILGRWSTCWGTFLGIPKTRIQNKESKIRDPKPRIQTMSQNRESKTRTPKPGMLNKESKIRDPKPRIQTMNQNRESKTRSPKQRIQTQESKIKASKTTTYLGSRWGNIFPNRISSIKWFD